jgi:pimeloyl-[acyl-carrier protein] methyl ester esterase
MLGRPVPILLLPGMDGTGELLDELAAHLSQSRPVSVLSYPFDGPQSYHALTAYAAAKAPWDRFAVLGESFSGPIAIELAASDPRAAGLILASSFAGPPLPSLLAPFVRLLSPAKAPAWIAEAALLGSTGTPELRARMRKLQAKLPARAIQARAAEALRADKQDRLRQVACPVLCLYGTRDRVTPMRCVRRIVEAQPRCQLRKVDAAHMLLETHAQEAARVIGAFCGELR